MMDKTVNMLFEPLIRRKIFASERDAVRELLGNYILQQISTLQSEINRFRQKYGMNFERFSEYLHERSALLQKDSLSPDKRKVLGRAIMVEEDDWLDWKVAREMLESWLGLREEVSA